MTLAPEPHLSLPVCEGLTVWIPLNHLISLWAAEVFPLKAPAAGAGRARWVPVVSVRREFPAAPSLAHLASWGRCGLASGWGDLGPRTGQRRAVNGRCGARLKPAAERGARSSCFPRVVTGIAVFSRREVSSLAKRHFYCLTETLSPTTIRKLRPNVGEKKV